MSREKFEITLEAQKTHAATLSALQAEVDASFEAKMKAAWKARFPKSRAKFTLARCLKDLGDEHEVLRKEHWDTVCEPIWQAYSARQDALKAELLALAENLDPQPGEEWTRWYVSWSSTYSSQGFGALQYAVGAAELKADHARYHSLEVKIERTNAHTTKDWGIAHADFEVWVKASPLDLAILDRKPGPTLREAVRLSWKRGVNPRVFNPFLPHGYEEKVGIDYYGNDLKA